MDTEIFTLLKEQAIEVFIFLLITREFASGRGMQKDVEKINEVIAENIYVLALANSQLYDLEQGEINNQMGIFDAI